MRNPSVISDCTDQYPRHCPGTTGKQPHQCQQTFLCNCLHGLCRALSKGNFECVASSLWGFLFFTMFLLEQSWDSPQRAHLGYRVFCCRGRKVRPLDAILALVVLFQHAPVYIVQSVASRTYKFLYLECKATCESREKKCLQFAFGCRGKAFKTNSLLQIAHKQSSWKGRFQCFVAGCQSRAIAQQPPSPEPCARSLSVELNSHRYTDLPPVSSQDYRRM